MKIDTIDIGNTPLVIPEIGINHGGSLHVAKEMADAAFRAGARLIKHQTHIAAPDWSPAIRRIPFMTLWRAAR